MTHWTLLYCYFCASEEAPSSSLCPRVEPEILAIFAIKVYFRWPADSHRPRRGRPLLWAALAHSSLSKTHTEHRGGFGSSVETRPRQASIHRASTECSRPLDSTEPHLPRAARAAKFSLWVLFTGYLDFTTGSCDRLELCQLTAGEPQPRANWFWGAKFHEILQLSDL